MTLNIQEIANTMWAFGVSDFRHPGLNSVVSKYLSANISSVRDRSKTEITNIVWSMIILGMHTDVANRSLISTLWQHCNDCNANPGSDGSVGMPGVSIMSLAQAQLAVQTEVPEEEGWRLEFAEGVVIDGVNTPKLNIITSKFQDSVQRCLKRHFPEMQCGLGLTEELVVQTPGVEFDILTLDIAHVETKVGVEVDGPGHFIVDIGAKNGDGQRKRPNGSTQLKDRLLTKLGWTVLHVEHWEWEQHDTTGHRNNRELLARKMREKGVDVGGSYREEKEGAGV